MHLLEYIDPSMVYWTPYLWYIKSPTYSISNPLPIVFWPPYQWNIKPPLVLSSASSKIAMEYWPPLPHHVILKPILMAYRPHYLWYFESHSHVILNPLTISWLEMRGFKITWGFDLPYRGNSFFNRGLNIPWCQYVKGFKIPYDTSDK